jgi:hypothetical protein
MDQKMGRLLFKVRSRVFAFEQCNRCFLQRFDKDRAGLAVAVFASEEPHVLLL